MQLNPYLNFDGQCKEAFQFYEKLLGGKIVAMLDHEGIPDEGKTPPGWGDKILHARMTVGDSELMASDVPPGSYAKPQGNYVQLGLDSPAEAERVFEALAENGKIEMPLQKTFWTERFGMVVDRFGTPWIING